MLVLPLTQGDITLQTIGSVALLAIVVIAITATLNYVIGRQNLGGWIGLASSALLVGLSVYNVPADSLASSLLAGIINTFAVFGLSLLFSDTVVRMLSLIAERAAADPESTLEKLIRYFEWWMSANKKSARVETRTTAYAQAAKGKAS